MEVEQLEVSQENASSRWSVTLGAVDPGPFTSDFSKKIDTFRPGISLDDFNFQRLARASY